MKRKKEKLEPPSELFADTVCDGGTLNATCGLCGREHYATNAPNHYDAGEIEALEEKHKLQPNKYIPHRDSDYVGIGWIAGHQVVWGCECNKLRDYENFILAHRRLIVTYLKALASNELKDAQSKSESVGAL